MPVDRDRVIRVQEGKTVLYATLDDSPSKLDTVISGELAAYRRGWPERAI